MRAETATIWQSVLYLPSRLASMTWPSAAAMLRSPSTAKSLMIISATTHAGARPTGIRSTRAALMMILSAMGSRSFPMRVTMLYRRAT